MTPHLQSNAANRDLPRPNADVRDEARTDAVNILPSETTNSESFRSVNLPPTPDVHPSSPNVPSRPDAAERAPTRSDAVERDEARLDAVVREETLINSDEQSEESEIDWLDIEQAWQLLCDNGISRTIRTVQKMCKRGEFTARLIPADNGVRYIISEPSINEFIIRHNEKLPAGGFTEDDLSSNSAPAQAPLEKTAAGQETGSSEQLEQALNTTESHLDQIIELKDQHIDLLQSQLNTANAQMIAKDVQIATMHERDHETNVLIQNLQRMFGLPEARPSAEIENRTVGSKHQNASGFEQTD